MANGVALVDTKNPNTGQAIMDQVRMVTPKPVTTIINTHTHADHTGSNEFFTDNVTFVAHENTKANMEKMTNFAGDKAKFLPSRVYKDTLTLGTGADQIGQGLRIHSSVPSHRARPPRGAGWLCR